MKDRSHIVWPAVVIFLLAGSVIMMFGVMLAATSDGGVQVVDRYYEKAAGWDSAASIQRTSNALNWTVRIDVTEMNGKRMARLDVTDPTGEIIEGLSGTAVVSRPQQAAPVGEHELIEITGERGYYGFEFPYHTSGLWDITVDASAGPNRLVRSIRIEL